MNRQRQTVFFQPYTQQVITRREQMHSPKKPVSTIINDTFRRFERISKQTAIPKLTAEEADRLAELMTDAAMTLSETMPGQMHAQILAEMRSPVTGDISSADLALADKLKRLSVTQQIVLLDQLGF